MKPKPIVRMHSAEHLLTALMKHLFGSPRNLEMHLGVKKTKCDYGVAHPLSDEEISAIETAVNAEIKKDHAVMVQTVPIENATTVDLWKVPKETTAIRIVRIGNFDATPCSGEHVSHTRQIGRFRVKSFTMKDERIVRIRFTLEED